MNIFSPGARSLHNSHRITRQSGFTLVEVLLTVVIIALTLALGVPSFKDQADKRHLTNATEQIVSFVNTTQGIASRTNQVVTVSYSRTDNDQWCVGATVGDTPCDCTESASDAADFCAIDGQKYVLDNTHTGNLELMNAINGDGAYAFDPVRGIFTDMNDAMEMKLRSRDDDFRLNVQVNSVGRVTTCSESASHAVPGYHLCAEAPDQES